MESVAVSCWPCFSLGESVDDCGGGYSESIAEICEELQNGLTPLLIVTPNGRDESGANRDCYLFSPAARAPVHTNMFRFLGRPLVWMQCCRRAAPCALLSVVAAVSGLVVAVVNTSLVFLSV